MAKRGGGKDDEGGGEKAAVRGGGGEGGGDGGGEGKGGGEGGASARACGAGHAQAQKPRSPCAPNEPARMMLASGGEINQPLRECARGSASNEVLHARMKWRW